MTRTLPQLKPITKAGVVAALLKGHRYRVLNDSIAAESICLDVLAIEPENVEALVMHVLAITDQFTAGRAEDLARAGAAVGRLSDPYKHAYYNGVIAERWAKSVLQRAALRVRRRWRTTGSRRRSSGMPRPRTRGRRGMTRRSCGGTPVCGCCSGTRT